MRTKRPVVSKQILVSLLVIALTTVIAVQGGSVSGGTVAAMAKDPTVASAKEQQVAPVEPSKSSSPVVVEAKEKSSSDHQVAARSAADAVAAPDQKSPAAAAAAITNESGSKVADSEQVNKRKGRADPVVASSPTAASDISKPSEPANRSTEKPEEKPTQAPAKPAEPKASNNSKGAAKQQHLSGKSGSKSKLPANLGTVTSTGSGGATHYMSKHDAYSAIAEKHGALAQDAMRKSDKRHHGHLQGFGGIQKASGFGDVLSPFKGVTDSGLARTLGASMRSIMKSKYSVPAYVASALLGAVALMAFYESPISPLPVPPLPEPPIGRFPPEMPNISPNTQVPFRQPYGGGQNYNQRSLNVMQQQGGSYLNNNQQQQQVLFPGNSNNDNNNLNQVAQQRQMNVASAGPVQQLAANLLSVGKQQNAQRKSGIDYDPSSSRSFFGGSQFVGTPKINAPVNQQQQPAKQNSFLSFFGLGGSNSGPVVSSSPTGLDMISQASGASNLNSPQVNGIASLPIAAAVMSSIEPKGQSSGLSNSHLVNKVKSFFSRSSLASPTSGSSSGAGVSNSGNPYDQYQRMSFVQALMKDTAFLPAFLSPTRKSSSSSPSSSAASSSSTSNKVQPISSALSSVGTSPAARMQVGGEGQLAQATPTASKQKPASSGYGFVGRAADRIAHALLETFTSGIVQRSSTAAHPASQNSQQSVENGVARKLGGSGDESSQSSPIASATSLISDIMSSYSANLAEQSQVQQQQQHEQAKSAAASQSQQMSQQQQVQQQQQQQQQANQHQHQTVGEGQASARSADTPVVSANEEHHHTHGEQKQQQSATDNSKQQVTGTGSSSSSSSDAARVRKTRSIGLEYPVESNQELVQREQQPSKAAQINNVIDFVSDSYTQNRLLFNFVMNQVGLSQAVPYFEQILASGNSVHI